MSKLQSASSPYGLLNSTIQTLPIVLTTAEVAKVLRCSEATVERYVYSHDLAAIQIGRERRFRADDLVDFIASRPTAARNGRKRTERRNVG